MLSSPSGTPQPTVGICLPVNVSIRIKLSGVGGYIPSKRESRWRRFVIPHPPPGFLSLPLPSSSKYPRRAKFQTAEWSLTSPLDSVPLNWRPAMNSGNGRFVIPRIAGHIRPDLRAARAYLDLG